MPFVEEEFVEVVAEVVVMRHVLLRLADRVRLLEALHPARETLQHILQRIGSERERFIENRVRKSRRVEPSSKLMRPSI